MIFQTLDLENDPRILRATRGRKSKPIPQLFQDAAEALISRGDELRNVNEVSVALILPKCVPTASDRDNAKLHGTRTNIIRKIVAWKRPNLFVQGRIVLLNGAPTYVVRVERIVPKVAGNPTDVLVDSPTLVGVR